jgi:type IV secretory pathway component VirB8
VVVFFISAMLIINTANVTKESQRYQFPIYFNNDVKYFPKIQSIGNNKENINLSVAKYLIINYLKMREEFDENSLIPEKLNEKLNYVNNVSSLKVFQKYFKFINIDDNPDSPLLKYRYKNSRIITIDKVVFSKDVIVPSYAKVYYKVRSLIDKKENIENKIAEVTFFISEINKKFVDSKQDLNFLITD